MTAWLELNMTVELIDGVIFIYFFNINYTSNTPYINARHKFS